MSSYYNILHFQKEPFSNSPEPELLFAAPQYDICLQMLEMSVRLKRGLSIVIGDVGTGKTTMCRKLIQNLSVLTPSEFPDIDTYLLLDPAVKSPMAFVKTVAAILGIQDISAEDSEWQLKEKIKNFLFEKGVNEKRIIVLIIDEGQKIPGECLEILREFLNYETNDAKLLQTIIFAQPELKKSLAARPNLMDRVDYIHHFKPLNFRQMKAMIEYRISVARRETVNYPLFTFGGLLAVYFATGGYPRKIVSLCHQALLKMIIRGKRQAGWFLVRSCSNKAKVKPQTSRLVVWGAVATAVLVVACLYWIGPEEHRNNAFIGRALSGIYQKKEALHIQESAPPLSAATAIPATPELLPSAEKPETDIAPEKTPEPLLGSISRNGKPFLWNVVNDIYGDAGEGIMRQFMLANPQIKDARKMAKDVVIHAPLVMDMARPIPSRTILVSLQSGNELEPLYYAFVERKNQAGLPGLTFLSFWSKREGRKFEVVLSERFVSEQAAQEAINRLPPEFAVSAKILSDWGDDMVCFNRRFAVGK